MANIDRNKIYRDMKDETAELLVKIAKVMRNDVREMKKIMTSSSKMVYTNPEVMELLGIGTKTLKQWRDAGLLGYSKVGNTFLYSKEDVAAFLKMTHYDAYMSDIKYRESLKDL